MSNYNPDKYDKLWLEYMTGAVAADQYPDTVVPEDTPHYKERMAWREEQKRQFDAVHKNKETTTVLVIAVIILCAAVLYFASR